MNAAANSTSDTDGATLPPEVQDAWDRLFAFCLQPEFVRLVEEMWSLPSDLQHEFAEAVFLDPAVLAARGIVSQPDVCVQRSWFADRRPTVLCVTAKLPDHSPWDKITVTFDAPTGSIDAPVWRHSAAAMR